MKKDGQGTVIQILPVFGTLEKVDYAKVYWNAIL